MTRAGLSTDGLALAGADLADEVGFAQVTVSELARRVGVRTPSLYAHVAGTDDLRRQIARVSLEQLADAASSAMAGRSGREALAAFAGAYRDFAQTHPGRYDATRFRIEPGTAAGAAATRHAELSRAILRGYAIEEPDQTHAVRLLGATIHGFSSLEACGGFRHSKPGADHSWVRAIDALHLVLTDWSTPR